MRIGTLTDDGANTYTWDARNQLSAISGASTASFVYDAFGRRVSKTINGVTTQFLYDGLNPVQELNGANPPSVIANLLTGLNIDQYFARTDSSSTMAFLRDALGSTVGLVNSAGNIDTSYTGACPERSRREPFGNTTISGSSANAFQFTGRENDGTGLYFYRARYYSPTLQRFVSQDPVLRLGNGLVWLLLRKRAYASQRLNGYVYALNDPLLFLDPLGLGPLCIGQWIPLAQNIIAAPVGDPLTGGGTGFCFCYWGCRACNGSLDLYNSVYDRPWTSGVETGGGECVAPTPGPQTGCSGTSSSGSSNQ